MADTADPADPTTDPAPPAPPPADPPAPPATGDADLAAEVEKWKSLARKNEDRAKANADAAKELEKLKTAQMSDNERAVAEAEQRGRTAALTELGTKLAAAEIKAALTGLVPDPAAVIEDLNLAKYVTDTGDVNAEAVTALRTKWQGIVGGQTTPPPPPPPPGDGGARGNSATPGQLTKADVDRLRAEGKHAEIAKARREGRLDAYMAS